MASKAPKPSNLPPPPTSKTGTGEHLSMAAYENERRFSFFSVDPVDPAKSAEILEFSKPIRLRPSNARD